MSQIRSIRKGDEDYPSRLQGLEMAPERLYLRGAWDDARRCVALVGSRAASAAGMAVARTLARSLAQAGVTVLSGGAIGIDHAAHSGALASGGVTCAVLGTGIDVAYPQRHGPLYEEIVARGGCLLSPFPFGTPAKPWHFPARNRVIAALADVIIIVEAQAGSGSSYTATAARQLGRQVAAVPGSPGTNSLLLEGARRVTSAADVMALLELPASALVPRDDAPRSGASDVVLPVEAWDTSWQAPALEGTTAQVWGALDQTPRDLGELSIRAGLPTATCAAVVVDLELRGRCTRLSGGRYVAAGSRE